MGSISKNPASSKPGRQTSSRSRSNPRRKKEPESPSRHPLPPLIHIIRDFRRSIGARRPPRPWALSSIWLAKPSLQPIRSSSHGCGIIITDALYAPMVPEQVEGKVGVRRSLSEDQLSAGVASGVGWRSRARCAKWLLW